MSSTLALLTPGPVISTLALLTPGPVISTLALLTPGPVISTLASRVWDTRFARPVTMGDSQAAL